MINTINKLREPKVNDDSKVISWTFGIEIECTETQDDDGNNINEYLEESVTVEEPKSVDSFTKVEIDALYDSLGLLAKVTNKLDCVKAKPTVSFNYDDLQ